jgi:putative Mn2+ efflux pump MntP
MNTWTLFTLAVGLSMDAFAVAVCKGLAMGKITFKNSVIIGLWFGGFQALMPALGFFLGIQFNRYIVSVDHWVAWILLCLIGGNMIKESLSKDEDDASPSVKAKDMFILAVATSIDALAVGITFAFLNVEIVSAVSFIGITTFIISIIGVKAGSIFGSKYKSKAEFIGGVILIILGFKILFEHLGFL